VLAADSDASAVTPTAKPRAVGNDETATPEELRRRRTDYFAAKSPSAD
jgi:hypothetical protein